MLPSSCLDGSVTGGSRSKPTVHRCRPKTGGCGLLTRTQDEPTKTGASVAVPQPASQFSAVCDDWVCRCSRCEHRGAKRWSLQQKCHQKHRNSASRSSARTRWSATTRSWKRDAGGAEQSQFQPSVRSVIIVFRVTESLTASVRTRRHQRSFV